MTAPAPELPKRVPGTSLALSLNYEVFAPTPPPIVGEPICFECEREPAEFELTTITPTLNGGRLASSNRLGTHCVGKVAVGLPRNVDVLITRLRKEPV